MLDLNKKYYTMEGKLVEGLQYIPYNSSGNKVTFPYKGSVRINKQLSIYQIWTEEGKTFTYKASKYDIVINKEGV